MPKPLTQPPPPHAAHMCANWCMLHSGWGRQHTKHRGCQRPSLCLSEEGQHVAGVCMLLCAEQSYPLPHPNNAANAGLSKELIYSMRGGRCKWPSLCLCLYGAWHAWQDLGLNQSMTWWLAPCCSDPKSYRTEPRPCTLPPRTDTAKWWSCCWPRAPLSTSPCRYVV
jgi:hypothetical protein